MKASMRYKAGSILLAVPPFLFKHPGAYSCFDGLVGIAKSCDVAADIQKIGRQLCGTLGFRKPSIPLLKL